ncbi:hypothetical protein SLEP1_g59243 [Rubroshorea leprosula]|uniref:Uncharacterized protein n=1 Tax=Rubroshorea leprosula TaxID=152421 RepID=A0AAV5MSX6_9ROSI|nr:hypothetical protein SLEP1_g59243 [Rubroshorea leprosula]
MMEWTNSSETYGKRGEGKDKYQKREERPWMRDHRPKISSE